MEIYYIIMQDYIYCSSVTLRKEKKNERGKKIEFTR